MKRRYLILPVALLMSWSAFAAPDARLALPEFASLADKASEEVNITLDPALLRLAASFLDADDPDDAAVKELIGGLKGIYVKHYSFDEEFAYPVRDIDTVRKQLTSPGWQRLVEVKSKKERANVDIYISMEQDKPNGLAIIASEPREFTIVNIVGPIDLQKLRKLEGKLGVPNLQLEEKKESAKPAAK
jgi:Domain of unknown function (DUF4252)